MNKNWSSVQIYRGRGIPDGFTFVKPFIRGKGTPSVEGQDVPELVCKGLQSACLMLSPMSIKE